MMKIKILCIPLLLLCLHSAQAATPFDYYPALFDTMIAGNYDAADEIALQIQAVFPGHPVSMLARAAVKGFRAADVTGSSDVNSVLSLLDSTAEVAEQYKENPHEDPATLSLVRGSALFGRGLILCRMGKLFKGVPDVIRARNEFGRVIELKPELYDAYLGRGAFRYIKVIFLGGIDPFHLVSSPQAAKADMMKAVDNGTFTHYLAMAALAWVVPKQEEFAFADSLCAVGLQRYPEARTFLWPLGFSKIAHEKWAEAEPVVLKLLGQYQQIPADNGYEQTFLYDWLTTCADSLGRPDDALNYAKAGVAVQRSERVNKERSDWVKRLEKRVKKG
jgi:hypothetical protein